MSVVNSPASRQQIAIPLPIVPAPMIPTLVIERSADPEMAVGGLPAALSLKNAYRRAFDASTRAGSFKFSSWIVMTALAECG
jgi:hypothetical protein